MRRATAAAWLFLSACGGHRFFLAREKAEQVKKVAVVQYAINPHQLVGVAATEEAKRSIAAENLETFGRALAPTYQVVPPVELLASPAYAGAGGRAAWDGYGSGQGMHYFSDSEDALTQAQLTPEVAKKLCAALGVDGVIAVYDSWGVEPFAMGFKGRAQGQYAINLFDRDGARVWGGTMSGVSDADFPTPGSALGAELDVWVKANNESFSVAVRALKSNIGAK
ncbi:MAG: hypothetical protein IPJ65_38510 [Archangiaceae bacterium]|nr:hypothetical protein [Archangiaceae bacterium]